MSVVIFNNTFDENALPLSNITLRRAKFYRLVIFTMTPLKLFVCVGLFVLAIRQLELFQSVAPNILYANMYRCNPFVARFSISNDYGFSENEWFSSKTTAMNRVKLSAHLSRRLATQPIRIDLEMDCPRAIRISGAARKCRLWVRD